MATGGQRTDAPAEFGRVSGVETAAIGCNWSLAPIMDLLRNWPNPIISHRAFGADPELVSAYGRGYVKGAKESNIICAA